KTRIMVVDDDPEIVELFVDVLERDGRFEVKTASTGYDAGVLTQEFMPDLVILDYMLPDINGNVVCQTIRKNPNFEHIKIIIVSGVVNQDEINDLLKAGADEFVKKPFNIEKLIERIGQLASV
ncbi:MAG TPA: response regulator transcription factor, partial [Tepidisphaeraceae bacterium]|nr:response regulator transcription factor [Tepidisphaeraceae bacterium]